MGLVENVIKECEEEAGIPPSLAKKAIATGAVSYTTLPEEGGVKQDVLFTFDLPLPQDFIPRPVDGEVPLCRPSFVFSVDPQVESFSLLPISEVQRLVRQTTEYKPNCAVVIIDFFLRHGLVSPDQKGYLALLESLRRGPLS